MEDYSFKFGLEINEFAKDVCLESVMRAESNNYVLESYAKIIFDELKNNDLFESLKAMFLENSTISFTLLDNALPVNRTWKIHKEFSTNIELLSSLINDYASIIGYLQEQHSNVFWHPQIIRNPKNPAIYWSILDNSQISTNSIAEFCLIESDSDYEKIKDILIEIDKNYNLNNESTPIKRFSEFTQDSILKDFLSFNEISILNMPYNSIYEEKCELVEQLFGERVETLHKLNHWFYHKWYFSNKNLKGHSVFLTIPLIGSPVSEGKQSNYLAKDYSSYGALFFLLYFEEKPPSNLLYKFLKSIKDPLYHSTNTFSANFLLKTGLTVREKLARKSAVAAVMSRNMSHNIGSHVLYKLSETATGKHNLLYAYLQKRMEFIAEISTHYSPLRSVKSFCRDVLCGFSSVKLLTDNISGIEGLGSEKIKIVFNGNACNIDNHLHCSPSTDLDIEVPSDSVGIHAIYVILENIIRNAAKHSVIDSKLTLTIKVDKDFNDDFYKVTVIDNLGDEKNKNVRLNLDENGKQINSANLIDKLNNLIDAPILKDGELRHEGWGLLEMKICAAYLRGEVLATSEESINKEMPFLKCSFYDSDGKKSEKSNDGSYKHWNLGFEFFLLKPKFACLLINDNHELNTQELKSHGIDIIIRTADLEQYDKIIKYGTRHEFLIIEGEVINITNNQNTVFLDNSEIQKLFPEKPVISNIRNILMRKLYPKIEITNYDADTDGDYHYKVSLNKKSIVFDEHDNWLKNNMTVETFENLNYYQFVGSLSGFPNL